MQFFDPFKNAFNEIWKQFKPPRERSWQTLILLSIFSWLMSLLTETPLLREALARIGWVFLTIGVGWALYGTRVNILGFTIAPGPWITGALAATFLFQGWTADPVRVALVSWPLISVAIDALPKFLPGFVPFLPLPQVRQDLIITALVGALLSCWFQFYYVINDWLRDYPSLLADDFSRSAFVVRFDQEPVLPRGVLLVERTAQLATQQLQLLSWSEVERWLVEADQRVKLLKPRVLLSVPQAREDSLWEFQGVVTEPDYTLRIRTVWRGASSVPSGYYVEKACRITQGNTSPATGQILPQQPVDPAASGAGQITPLQPTAVISCGDTAIVGLPQAQRLLGDR